MLKRVQIENFRSIKNVSLDDLGTVTALVGRNGAGKTNILKAIEWASLAAVGSPRKNDPDNSLEIVPAVSLEMEIDGSAVRYTTRLTTSVHSDETETSPAYELRRCLSESIAKAANGGWQPVLDRSGEEVKIVGRDTPLRIGATAPCLSAIATLLPEDDALVKEITPLILFLRAVRYYGLDEPSDANQCPDGDGIIPGETYAKWIATSASWNDGSASVPMRILQMFLEQRDQFDELKSLLGPNGLGLINDVSVFTLYSSAVSRNGGNSQSNKTYYLLGFAPSGASGSGRESFALNQLSVGTRRILRILVSMIFDRSSVMLIEQPEDSVHAGLVKKLIHLLQSNAESSQIILASHSASLLNQLSPQDVRVVTMANGITEVRTFSGREIAAASQFIEREGSLSDFLEAVEET